MEKVTILGLGYVGLPLALLAGRKGYDVTGIDINEPLVASLQDRSFRSEDIEVNKSMADTKVNFTNSFDAISESSIIIVCVPTPVDHDKQPDLGPVEGAIKAIAPRMTKGAVLVVESTINPGVCDDIVITMLQELSDLTLNEDYYVAHCPERINPGDTKWSVENINRVVGASAEEGLKKAAEFYRAIITGEVKEMATIKEAEAVKIVENTFRDINIAFVNELAMSFHKMGINLENVIDGAATKPFAFMPHHPGCGVGGHCIPVDPYYLIERARGFGFDHVFLKAAREINESMPEFTCSLLVEGQEAQGIDRASSNVVVLGQSYKNDIADFRESPAVNIYNKLVEKGYNAKRHDPFSATNSDVASTEEALDYADSVVLATGHKEYRDLKPEDFAKHGIRVLVDGRNVYRNNIEEFKKLGIHYVGIGVS